MENVIQKVRKVVIVIGCIAIFVFFCNMIWGLIVQNQSRAQLIVINTNNLMNSEFALIISFITTFFVQSCQALLLILIALILDPSKVKAVFTKNIFSKKLKKNTDETSLFTIKNDDAEV